MGEKGEEFNDENEDEVLFRISQIKDNLEKLDKRAVNFNERIENFEIDERRARTFKSQISITNKLILEGLRKLNELKLKKMIHVHNENMKVAAEKRRKDQEAIDLEKKKAERSYKVVKIPRDPHEHGPVHKPKGDDLRQLRKAELKRRKELGVFGKLIEFVKKPFVEDEKAYLFQKKSDLNEQEENSKGKDTKIEMPSSDNEDNLLSSSQSEDEEISP